MPAKTGHLSVFHRLRLALRIGKPAADPEVSRLVSRTPIPKTRRTHRQSTLSVPTELLLRALAVKLGTEDEIEAALQELSLLLRWQVRHTLQESSLWLVDAFDQLSSSDPQLPGNGGVSSIDWEAKREELSDRFIDRLCALMQRANYKLLSQREWVFAKSENFMFVMPVDVAWESLDSSLISRLFVRHPHLGLQAAQLSRRVLVFHRGSGLEQRTAWFLEEKLDMAIDKLFTHPFRRLYRSIYQRLCSRSTDADQGLHLRRNSVSDFEVAHGLRQTQRVNLGRLLPSLFKLLRRFFLRLTVQEPTFQEVVVFYSELGSANMEPLASNGSASISPTENSMPQMRLKSFRDIPIADVEVVFPGLRVERMKSADVVKILLILLAGVATALYGYFFAQGGGWTVRATLIGLLALRAFQTWRYVLTAKATMDDFIRSTLYHRSQDSQKGVLLYVLNSIEQHEHRESLLLYSLMLAQTKNSSDDPTEATALVTIADAEVLCSSFLEGEFGMAVQLDIEAAMARLLAQGLVRSGGSGNSYEAVQLSEALAKLRQDWANLRASNTGVAVEDPISRSTSRSLQRASPHSGALDMLTKIVASPRI